VKFKYYLRGCGLGIILTVLVLGISLALRGGVMTDEKVIARAGELGMVMPGDLDSGESVAGTEALESTQMQETTQASEELNGTEVNDDADETDAGAETADESQATSVVSRVMASAPADTADTSGTTASETSSESVDTAESEEAPDPEKTSDSGKSVTVRVKKGDVCREVAEKLERKGLISDAEGFRKYMQKKGYDNRICIGSFTIKQGMTYEEIAKILVGNT
jgi:hypothetical protein